MDQDTAIQRLQDQIAREAGEVVQATLLAPMMRKDLLTGAWVIPPQWIADMGPEAAEARAAVAAAAWMNAKEAPVFIKVASSVLVGMMRARAERESGNRTLNVSLVRMEVATDLYPTLEVDNDK